MITDQIKLYLMFKELSKRSSVSLDMFNPNQIPIVTCSNFLIALLAPRRWGKTEGGLRWAIDKCKSTNRRDVRCAYIAQHRTNAKDIAWTALNVLDEKLKVGFKFNNVDLLAKTKSGNTIKLYGADDERFARLMRGPSFDLVIIDEAQGFINISLGDFIKKVLLPTLVDNNGKLLMQGTPGEVPYGYFWEVVWAHRHQEWSVFEGEPFSNPRTEKQMREQLNILKSKNPNIEQEPWVQREFFGRWVSDNRSNVIKITEGLNYLYFWERQLEDRYCLGIDLGFDDPSAYVVCCENHRRYDYLVYVEAFQRKGMMLHEHVTKCKEYMDKYPGILIFSDTAGHAKSLIEEMRRNGVGIYPANKTEKRTHVERLNSEATIGKIKIYNMENPSHPEKSLVAEQWRDLIRVFKYSGDDLIGDELSLWEEGSPRHIHDAALYARRGFSDSAFQPLLEKTFEQKYEEGFREQMRRRAQGRR